MSLDAAKAETRKRAFAARKAAHGTVDQGPAQEHLRAAIAPHAGQSLAGYMPIRTEIDPRPVMAAWDAPVSVPVIEAEAHPLRFARWTPDTAMTAGAFGAAIPAVIEEVVPVVVIVPLVAFTETGDRLGYGGGFYDRTLAGLRARGPVIAVGFAFEAQCLPEVPQDPFDQPLDAIATEAGVRVFDRGVAGQV